LQTHNFIVVHVLLVQKRKLETINARRFGERRKNTCFSLIKNKLETVKAEEN
jgi:hypothetical protein